MMSFEQSLRNCFQKYFVFKGRAPRSEFWWFVLFIFVVPIIIGLVSKLTSYIFSFGLFDFFLLEWMFLALSAALDIPLLFVSIRRLHDVGKSWYWLLLYFIPALLLDISRGEFFLIVFSIPSESLLGENLALTLADMISNIYVRLLMLISVIWSLILFCKKGDEDENIYGPSPVHYVKKSEV